MNEPPPIPPQQPPPVPKQKPPPLPARSPGRPRKSAASGASAAADAPAGPGKRQGGQPSLGVPRTGSGMFFVRFGMFLLVAGSCWLLYWSFTKRLQPVIREQQMKTLEMTRLSDEVEQLKMKLAGDEVAQIKARYAAARPFLFAGLGDLNDWANEVRVQAGSMRLETMFQMGEPQPYPPAQDKLDLIRAQIGIRPAYIPGATNSPYLQLLHFTQNMAKSPKRYDLLELSTEGDTNSVKQALAVVQLLADGGRLQ